MRCLGRRSAFPFPFFSSVRWTILTLPACSASTLLTIFGGRVADLEAILIDEKLPEGWESRILEHFGLTVIAFNKVVSRVGKGTEGEKKE